MVESPAKHPIVWCLSQCDLGWLLSAKEETKICAVAFGDDPAMLVQWLERCFPGHDLRPGTEAQDSARQVMRVLKGQSAGPVAMAIQGTPFQMRVWRELRLIPRGQTITYGELASRMGRPGAARAVARACGANRLAGLIPCHRVVARNGLGGYRWGVDRKKALLLLEGATIRED